MRDGSFVTAAEGHRLFVRDWGAGPTVLFLAGWAMTSDLWGEVMLALCDAGLRCVAFDRRGHGRSDDPGRLDLDLLAQDLASVIATLDLSGVTVVAHSGAAAEIVRHVERHGAGRLGRIVMVGATGPCLLQWPDHPEGVPPEAAAAIERRIGRDLAAWIDENVEPFAPGVSRRVQDWLAAMALGCSRKAARDFQRVIAQADWRAACARLPVPVTVIHGDRDVSAPLDLTGRRIAALAPAAELLVYEGAAHGLMLTHADRLAADILARVPAPCRTVPAERM